MKTLKAVELGDDWRHFGSDLPAAVESRGGSAAPRCFNEIRTGDIRKWPDIKDTSVMLSVIFEASGTKASNVFNHAKSIHQYLKQIPVTWRPNKERKKMKSNQIMHNLNESDWK